MWVPAAIFVALAATVWLIVAWSVLHPPAVPPVQTIIPGASDVPLAFRGWVHWDASWYASISRDGYAYHPGSQSGVAFFPLYPMLIRGVVGVAALGGTHLDPFVAGSTITLLAGGASAILLWLWCRPRFAAATSGTAVALLLVYPYSIYLYGPVYADALFLAGTLAAFVLLERDRIGFAVLVAAITTAARPVGLIVAVALVLRLLERRNEQADDGRRRWDPRVLRPHDLWILLAGSGWLAYCAFLQRQFDDPFAFVTVQGAPGWEQSAGPQTWFKSAFFAEIARAPFGPASLGLCLQLGLALAALACVPLVARRISWAYAALVGLAAALPLLATKDFQGTGRYLLPAFPVFAVGADALAAHPRIRRVTLAAGTASLLLFASWFAKGNYLA